MKLIARWTHLWRGLADMACLEIVGLSGNRVLAGCRTPNDLLARTPCDDAALALVELAQSGSTLAGRVVVQAMLPRLTRLASRDPRADVDDYLTEAWLVVMGYPLHRSHAVLTNLTLDTLKRVSRARARTRHEIPLFPTPEPPATEPPAASSQLTADELIDLAASQGVISAQNLPAVCAVYADGLSGKDAAAHLGISHTTLRYRCSQAIKAMRRHRELLLSA